MVESHPLLWNKAHPDYGNVKRLEDTWQLVADEMDLDVEDCKDKWNSLRAQFRRLRRKILQSSVDATGIGLNCLICTRLLFFTYFRRIGSNISTILVCVRSNGIPKRSSGM